MHLIIETREKSEQWILSDPESYSHRLKVGLYINISTQVATLNQTFHSTKWLNWNPFYRNRCFVLLQRSQRYRLPYITVNKFYWKSQSCQRFPCGPFHVFTCIVISWYLSSFLDKRWCYPKTGSSGKACGVAYFVVVTRTYKRCHIRTMVYTFWKCITCGEQRNNIFRGPCTMIRL